MAKSLWHLGRIGMFVAALWVPSGVALASANEPVEPYTTKGMTYDAASKTVSIEEAQVNLVVPQASTIQDDLHIRITEDGWTFLAKVLKINLVGMIKQSEIDAGRGPQAGKQTLHAVLNDEVIGMYEPFSFDGGVLGPIDMCIALYPDARGASLNKCACNQNPTSTWGGRTLYTCGNCLANAANNPFSLAWSTSISVKDPYDPLGLAGPAIPMRFGPFFKEALEFQLWSGAHNGVDVFVGNNCVADPATGNYPSTAAPNGCYQYSPKIAIALANADAADGDDGLASVVIQLNLYGLRVHGDLGLQFNCGTWLDPLCDIARLVVVAATGGDSWIEDTGNGLIYLNTVDDFLHAKLYARMIDGYWTMAGKDGGAVGSGGGPPPADAGFCAAAGSGASCTNGNANTCPIGHQCVSGACVAQANILAPAVNAPLLDLLAQVDKTVSCTWGGCCTWSSAAGFCVSDKLHFASLGNALLDGILDLLGGMLTDLVVGKLGPVIGGLVGGILSDTVGLPIDFNQIFTGGPFTRLDLCALRDSQPTTPSCNNHPNNGRGGTCACDNFDLDAGSLSTAYDPNIANPVGNTDDRQLNYMDWNDLGDPDGVAGGPAGQFQGTVPNDIAQWYDNADYGVGKLGGWTTLGGVDSPDAPYDLGAYLTSQIDLNTGLSLLMDLAFTPKFTTATVGTYSCFGGTVWSDPTGPDNVTAGRAGAASWTPNWGALDTIAGVEQHILIGLSQYTLEEAMYMMLTSGILCFNFSADTLGGSFGDLLKVTNMKTIIPAVDPATNPTVGVNSTVTALFRPSGTPTVRVLGNRNIGLAGAAGEWPLGDCIPNDALNTHTNANLNILDETNAVGGPCTAKGAYDMMIALPHFQVEFWLDPGAGAPTQLFEQDIDIVLTLAAEYTKTGPATTVFSTNYSQYLEVLLDVWMGCDGTVTKIGEQTGVNADANPNCITNLNTTLGVHKQGITSLIATLLSTRLSLLARTTFLLDGLTMDFNQIGPTGADNDVAADAGLKSYQRYGDTTGDWLAVAATFNGNLDLARLFNFLGGQSPAPYMLEPETYIIPAVNTNVSSLGDPTSIIPGIQYNLSPSQSAEFGFREYGTRFEFYSAPAVAKLDSSRDQSTMRFSYTLDGGPWTPFRSRDNISFDYLPNGYHLLEVRAKDKDDFADSTPAAIAFYVDSIAPTVALKRPDGTLDFGASRQAFAVGPDHNLTVVLADNVSVPRDIRGTWSLDGKAWHPLYEAVSTIALPRTSEGVQQVYFRAKDEFGNTAQQMFVLQDVAEDDGFGCNATAGGQWSMLAAMLAISVAARRRRTARA